MVKRISHVLYSHSSEQNSKRRQLVYYSCAAGEADHSQGTAPPVRMAKGKAPEVLRAGLISPTTLVVLFLTFVCIFSQTNFGANAQGSSAATPASVTTSADENATTPAPTTAVPTTPPATCNDPGSVTQATRRGVAPFLVGDSVTYTCLSNFRIVGAATLTCQKSQSWDAKLPTCQAVCSPHNDPANAKPGSASFSPAMVVGTTVTHDCRDGFFGTVIQTCQPTHVWSVTGSCQSCMCNANGSMRNTCNSDGVCSCKVGFGGKKCNGCTDSYYRYSPKQCRLTKTSKSVVIRALHSHSWEIRWSFRHSV